MRAVAGWIAAKTLLLIGDFPFLDPKQDGDLVGVAVVALSAATEHSPDRLNGEAMFLCPAGNCDSLAPELGADFFGSLHYTTLHEVMMFANDNRMITITQ